MKVSKNNGEHYIWGDACDGWHLVKDPSLSIIHERMPSLTEEARHYHRNSKQFFFVLSGKVTIELAGEIIELSQHEGVEVMPNVPHQVFNKSAGPVEFMVISNPSTKGDRTLA